MMNKELKDEDFKSVTGVRQFSQEEWQARDDLAALYRLAALFGYDDLIWNHITMRVPGTDHQFLLNKFGLLYTEVTASNLIKVAEHDPVIDGNVDVNTAGFVIHSAIHLAHRDMKVVFHAHVPEGLAATALEPYDGVRAVRSVTTVVVPSSRDTVPAADGRGARHVHWSRSTRQR